MAAVANGVRWLYHERTPISGMGFPELCTVQPPESNGGYYLDAPAYMGEPEVQMQQTSYYPGSRQEQFNGYEDELSGQNEEYGSQMYGEDTEIL